MNIQKEIALHITIKKLKFLDASLPPKKTNSQLLFFIWLLPFNIRCMKLINLFDLVIVHFHS